MQRGCTAGPTGGQGKRTGLKTNSSDVPLFGLEIHKKLPRMGKHDRSLEFQGSASMPCFSAGSWRMVLILVYRFCSQRAAKWGRSPELSHTFGHSCSSPLSWSWSYVWVYQTCCYDVVVMWCCCTAWGLEKTTSPCAYRHDCFGTCFATASIQKVQAQIGCCKVPTYLQLHLG